jgi:hypothetical protein
VTDERRPRSEIGDRSDALTSESDPALDALRDILLAHYRQRVGELETELDELEERVTDRDALIETISPVLGEAIRRQIRDSREEMIEALYPIIGQLVIRAVSEAVQDLARTVDARVRRSFDLRSVWWRIRARLGGVSQAEMSLRTSLPFAVTEIFLIHRETGLLLWHGSHEPKAARDSELFGSMLTAIRDFAQDAFGRGKEGQLEEIEYGDEHILLEATRHAYLAVVVSGVEPPGFRAKVRERLVEVSHRYARILRDYDGEPIPQDGAEGSLRPLMAASEPPQMTRAQKAWMVGAIGMVVICLVAACFASRWALSTVRGTPTPLPVAVQSSATITSSPIPTSTPTPTWTLTVTPSPSPLPTSTGTPTPTSTFTPTPTQTPTWTPTPAQVTGLMTGNAWLRQEPRADSARLGIIAERGTAVELLAVSGVWGQIHLSLAPGVEAVGWVPLRWLGTLEPIPAHLIAPTAGPQ